MIAGGLLEGVVVVKVAEVVALRKVVSLAVITMVFNPAAVPIADVIPNRSQVEPLVFVRASVVVPPIEDRSTVTVERLESGSVTVHDSIVEITPSERMEAGVKEQADITGGFVTGTTVEREAEAVALRLVVSVAVITMVFNPAAVPNTAVMAERSHVEPLVFVRAAEEEPPIEERSTVTVEIFEFISVTVQDSVELSRPSERIEEGVNEHAEIEGGVSGN